MSEAIRVLLVDDQPLVRTGFRLVLGTTDDIVVVGEANDGLEALQLLESGVQADVCCIDIRMPQLDGIDTTREIVQRQLPAKVIVLTTFDRDEYIYEALSAGASGFLLKDCGAYDLIAGKRRLPASSSASGCTWAPRIHTN